MRAVVFGVLALSLSTPALAGGAPPPAGTQAVAPGSIAGGKVVAFDPTKKVMTVEAGPEKIVLDISKANVAGELKVGAIVDVTHANGAASNVAVRPPQGGAGAPAPAGGPAPTAAPGTAVAPGAISGGKVIAFDAGKHMMTVDANGQKVDIAVGTAVINGQIAVGKFVDVTYANGAAQAINVRP